MTPQSRMTLYSFLSYADFYIADPAQISTNVASIFNLAQQGMNFQKIAWGPAAHKSALEHKTDSLALILQEFSVDNRPEYTLIFRGTNPISISSWLFQDLDVASMVPWIQQSPHSPAPTASISKAADTAMSLHRNLLADGQNLEQWFWECLSHSPQGIRLNITGHSLGGLMCSTFGLWLHEELKSRDLDHLCEIHIWGIATPTAGNRDYAQNFDSQLGHACYRFNNPIDLVPHGWIASEIEDILPTIYQPIMPNPIEKGFLQILSLAIRNKEFSQIGINESVPSAIFNCKPFQGYLSQAGYQHCIPYLKQALADAPASTIPIMIGIIKDLFAQSNLENLPWLGEDFSLMERLGLAEITPH